ncbi:uncharacterized protein LOC108682788 [Hyalella azteca]|uniref:Uncharacterized protein LOC108682788 n=1 Tax=Hyalella azteca TaxID=294128 RepID=A0A8B7PQG6_HYAAZ|nr:uncharacterized protein LOC108682788 [Hyalella azteca]
MKILMVAAVVAVASAAPQFSGAHNNVGFGSEATLALQEFGGGRNSFGGYRAPARECGDGEVLNTDGTCGIPEVKRKIYVFAARPTLHKPITPKVPEPEVNIDVILVKAPVGTPGGKPIVVPPPEQKTVVYVLSKRPKVGQEIIEVPSVPEEPEVYFVNYDDGDNPILPGGIDLQTALSQAAHAQGNLVEGGGSAGGGQYQAPKQQQGFAYNRF